MTTVIALDTSGAFTCIGVGRADAPGFAVRAPGGRKHAEVIDTLMHRVSVVLDSQPPDAIAVGVGPGPYSGLRVGIAFAIGLGRAWRRPVVGVCSLDAIAWAETASDPEATAAGGFVVTTDARRDEIYWARYDGAGNRSAGPRVTKRAAAQFDTRVVAEREVDPALMAARVARFIDDGHAPEPTSERWAPHGADGSQVVVPPGPLLTPRPLYLRAPDVTWSAGVSVAPTPSGGSA